MNVVEIPSQFGLQKTPCMLLILTITISYSDPVPIVTKLQKIKGKNYRFRNLLKVTLYYSNIVQSER